MASSSRWGRTIVFAGKALMLEALRRIRVLGARTARVTSFGDNAAATRLYASVGFSTFDTERFYRKLLDELASA